MRLLLLFGLVAGALGLKMPTPQLQSLKAAAFGATCSAALCLGALPAIAAPPSLNDAIVEFTEAVYPVIKVQNSALPDLSEQAAALIFNSVKPEKLATSIDLLFDAFATVPEEKITAFNDVVKDAFGDAKPPACQLVPLPPKSLTDKVLASAAFKQVDSAKLAAFGEKWGPTLKLLPTSDTYKTADGAGPFTVICLPPPEKLDRLALAQADLGRAFGVVEVKRFFDYTPGMLQKEVRMSDAMPLAQTASKMAYVPPDQKIRLNQATKAIEAAAKDEAAKARIEAIKAESAAKKAAMAARAASS